MDARCEEDALEASWRSLDLFRRSHSGRIEPDCQLERAISLDLEDGDNATVSDSSDASFEIPELPTGKRLKLTLLSTWGDPFYIGLNAVEIFTDCGSRAAIDQVCCDEAGTPTGIPKPEYAKIASLVDGHYKSHDDTRLWLAPFNARSPTVIVIEFRDSEARIGLIRIWNYNKSRVHASRGVRRMQMHLDNRLIFSGEISMADCAPTSESGVDVRMAVLTMRADRAAVQTVLFTTDETILERISRNDGAMRRDDAEKLWCEKNGKEEKAATTAPTGNSRPMTGESCNRRLQRQEASEPTPHCVMPAYSVDGDFTAIKGRRFTFELLYNWGSDGLIGLTGIQLIDRSGSLMQPTCAPILGSSPIIPQSSLAALTSGRNLTTREADMMLSSWSERKPIQLSLLFRERVEVIGVAFWNYNASQELSFAGVQCLNVYVNGQLVLDGAVLRKAPGNVFYDFVQEIYFGVALPRQLDATVICGFVFQLQLLSTWGDEFYIGLNGLRAYDVDGKPLPIPPQCVAAYPESVNVLPTVSDDPRTSLNLFDEQPNTNDPAHMWLAPLLPNQINRIYLVFDSPTTISKLLLYNYRKTPSRGARDVLMLVDDVILFSGEVPESSADAAGCLEIVIN